jgi:hypothetical protein
MVCIKKLVLLEMLLTTLMLPSLGGGERDRDPQTQFEIGLNKRRLRFAFFQT